MTPNLLPLILISTLILSCKHKEAICNLTIDAVIGEQVKLVLVNSSSQFQTEVRDIGRDTMVGGYYTFYKNRFLKSYYFFAEMAKPLSDLHKDVEYIEGDSTSNLVSYCTYAELYDSAGRVNKIVGIPLVYQTIKLLKHDSLFILLRFFSLNKTYRSIEVRTNNNNVFNLDLSDDTLYTNMKVASFSYDFKGSKDIDIYITAEYLENCSMRKQMFRDTISLNYEPQVKKYGM